MEKPELTTIREEISSAEARLEQLDHERAQLSRRIAELNAQLSSLRKLEGPRPTSFVAHSDARRMAPSTSEEKIALVMKLFRGRADVFPKRWENANKGTKGYSPACSNEWVPGAR